jgi:hypothetical protein
MCASPRENDGNDAVAVTHRLTLADLPNLLFQVGPSPTR